MFDWLRKMLELDAEAAIELGDGEEILHVTGRHWIVLLTRMILPALGLLIFGGLAFFRAAGGSFLVRESDLPVGLDLLNWLLIFLTAGLLVIWLVLSVRGNKTQGPRWVILGIAGALLVLVYYRYNGGRIFGIDPSLSVTQSGDILNITLIMLAVVSTFMCLFTFYDWLNDELILTNQRVIFDNDQVFIPRLIEQRVQEQIFLEDVQDVNAKTSTYPQHILNYGTVVVKSARFGGNIVFESASGPMDMQKRIMDQVRALRKRTSTADYVRMVDERVYGKQVSKGKLTRVLRRTRSAKLMNWLFLENPEIDARTDTYTWRPHWLFQIKALIGPTLLLLLGLLLVALMVRIVDPSPVWVLLSVGGVLFVCGLWTAWEVEDYRNDRYILNPTNVIDIEKKPFGPEDRRQASLGAITNVRFETTFISNLLGYGDVVLETAGAGGKFTFLRVPRPNQVVTTINEYIVNFRRGEREKNLNDTLDLLVQYHEAQKRYNEINPSAS